jgi:hypothetical protein
MDTSEQRVRLTHDITGRVALSNPKKTIRAAACAIVSGLLACGAAPAQNGMGGLSASGHDTLRGIIPGDCARPATGPAHTASPMLLQTGNGLLMVATSSDPQQLKMDIAGLPKRQRPAAVLLLVAGGDVAPAQALSRDLKLPVLMPVAGKPAASALFSKGSPSIQQSMVAWETVRLALLTHQAPGAAPALLAAVWKDSGNRRTVVAWHGRGKPAARPDPMLELAGLEHLYEFLLRQDPQDRYQLWSPGLRAGAAMDAKDDSMSHGAVLAAIAQQRECAALALGDRPAAAWRVVDMQEARQAATKPGDRDTVAVRIRAGNGPVPNATVTFARPPHMACAATTDAAGLARCRLVDTHGDADHHEDGDVIASFGGIVAPGRVDLPTTWLLQRTGMSPARSADAPDRGTDRTTNHPH